jgi:hypothetical protein
MASLLVSVASRQGRAALFPLSRRVPTLSARLPALSSRLLCTVPPEKEAYPIPEKEELIFEGGKTQVVKTLKRLSIANLGFALASTPLLYYITNATGHGGKGMAMSSLLTFFGGGTTLGLTWATSTYALSIKSIVGKDALLIETPTLMGGTQTTVVPWSSITRPKGYHPFATFEADGSKYFLDELGEMHCDSFPTRLEEILNKY